MDDDDKPVPDDPHVAGRPWWYCTACGKAWPCEPAQANLAKTHSPTQLAMLMWAHLESAAFDMPKMPVGVMFERFLSWTWRPPEGPSGLR